MQETAQNAFGFAHLWAAGDVVSHTVAYILAAMLIASWYLILAKAWDWYRTRRAARAVAGFWAATRVAEGIEKLRQNGEDSPYAQLAEQANCCNHECEAVTGRLASRFDPAEQMERALRQQLMVTQAGMERGLTLLASIGSTAPFIGLFGTGGGSITPWSPAVRRHPGRTRKGGRSGSRGADHDRSRPGRRHARRPRLQRLHPLKPRGAVQLDAFAHDLHACALLHGRQALRRQQRPDLPDARPCRRRGGCITWRWVPSTRRAARCRRRKST